MKTCLFCFLIFIICSCTIRRKIYSSTQINDPALEQKNDHSFAFSYSNPSGFDFTGGYALTNRLAVIGGAYSYRNSENQKESQLFSNVSSVASLLYRHRGYHGGVGVYFPFVKKTPLVYAAFFAGYTKGNFRMDEHNVETDHTTGSITTRDLFYHSDIGRYFMQGGINSYFNRFELSLLGRFNDVVYGNVSTNYTPAEQINYSFPPLGYSKNSRFLDIAGDVKYFFTDNRHIGMELFGSLTTRLNKKEFNFLYYNTRIGIGLVVRNPFKSNN